MFNPFATKKYPLEEEQDNSEPFDPRIKQIEAIRKNRLMQLEKVKQQAQKDLDDNSKKLNESIENTAQEVLYYALIDPIIEKKFVFIDNNVPGLTKWMDEVKLLRQSSQDAYNNYYVYVQDWLTYKQNFEHAKQEAHAMLIQTEKLALIETLWNENRGI